MTASGPGWTPQRVMPTSISTSTGKRTPAASAAACDAGDVAGVVGADGDLGDVGQGGEAGELGVADDLVADEDVGNAAPGQDLGLADLLDALADGAGGDLAMGDDGGFMRLGVGAEASAGGRQQRLHAGEVVLEGVEVEEQCGVSTSSSRMPGWAGGGWIIMKPRHPRA